MTYYVLSGTLNHTHSHSHLQLQLGDIFSRVCSTLQLYAAFGLNVDPEMNNCYNLRKLVSFA